MAYSSFVHTCGSTLFSPGPSTVVPQLTEWGSHCRQGPLYSDGGTDCSTARYAPCSVPTHECTSQCGRCAPLSRQLYNYSDHFASAFLCQNRIANDSQFQLLCTTVDFRIVDQWQMENRKWLMVNVYAVTVFSLPFLALEHNKT